MTTQSATDPEEYLDAPTGNNIMSDLVDVFPDAGSWVKSTFIVSLAADFDSYKEILEYQLSDETFSTDGEPALGDVYQEMIDEASFDNKSEDAVIPASIVKGKFRDTSLGGNDAINALPAFCENDDIIHPFSSLLNSGGTRGMGRVYSEMIDDNQQLMYMTFGVPKFSGVLDFYKDSIDGELANLMNSGDFFSIKTLGRLFGVTAGAIISLPFLPIIVFKKIGELIPDITDKKVTKYYDLKSTMPLYYKCVNTMIAHLAVNMNLVENGGASTPTTGSTVSNKSHQELSAEAAAEVTGEEQSVLGKEGFDIYQIMTRKYIYNRLAEETSEYNTNLDDIIDKYRQKGTAYDPEADGFTGWEEFLIGMGSGFQDALTYVGFRIEKSVDNSESVANTTGESELAATLNGRVSEAREKRFMFAQGNTGVGVLDAFLQGTKGVLDAVTQSVGIDGISKALMGSGRLDIPDVWKDSQFSKAYSFNMALRAPYGDPVSIMTSIYIPLSMLLAGALPRAVGPNAYTSPFLVSAYSKGMFSIPLGIIDSMTIKRGAEQHGWNYQSLPTSIDVSFTIKDLSPTMYMAVADSTSWKNVFGQNSTFQEYLLTLGGTGLAERLLWTKNVKRRFAIMKNIYKQQKLNPIAWGFNSASTKLGRIWTAVQPTADLGRYQPGSQ